MVCILLFLIQLPLCYCFILSMRIIEFGNRLLHNYLEYIIIIIFAVVVVVEEETILNGFFYGMKKKK